jgi:quinol monooxygenase YgiN
MIHVIATIEIKPNSREDFLTLLRENVPNVKAEAGCLRYEPALDIDSGLPDQATIRENVVTIIEAWESLGALTVHLKTPHMSSFFEKAGGYIENVNVQVMAPA